MLAIVTAIPEVAGARRREIAGGLDAELGTGTGTFTGSGILFEEQATRTDPYLTGYGWAQTRSMLARIKFLS